MINILIVEDSKLMRVNLRRILEEEKDFNVIAEARNGEVAIEIFDKTRDIDIVILDFFMPKKNGLEALRHIMTTRPTPTIMITIANKKEHADVYFKAIEMGAADIITKPSGLDEYYLKEVEDELKFKIRQFAGRKVKHYKPPLTLTSLNQENKPTQGIKQESKAKEKESSRDEYNTFATHKRVVVVIGVSTGGPPLLFKLMEALQYKPRATIIIVQHMPSGFTEQFAKRLDKVSEYEVFESAEGMNLRSGCAYVAPGGYHLKILQNRAMKFQLTKGEKLHGVRPSIDITMFDCANIFQENCVGIILSGMGQDGVRGMVEIKKHNGKTIAQDPEEAIIDSMPQKAINKQVIDAILPIDGIIQYLNTIL